MSKYTVHRGDTLNRIAASHHTTVAKLVAANHLHNANLIHTGQHLTIPGATDSFDHGSTKHTAHTTKASASGGNSSKEHRLASAARSVAMSMGGYHSQGLCATGVSRALARSLGIHVHGNGNQIDNNLPRSKFRQVNMSLAQALRTPGLILTWEHTSTRLGRKYGHTAVTLGDGHSSASDFIERNTLAGAAHRSGLKIFMPI